MVWCLPYSIFVLLPLSFGMSVTNFFVTMTRSRGTMQDDWFWVIFDSFALADLLEPIFFSLSVIIFLPAYRSTLFGMQGYSSPKVAGLTVNETLIKEKQTPSSQLTLPLPVSREVYMSYQSLSRVRNFLLHLHQMVLIWFVHCVCLECF